MERVLVSGSNRLDFEGWQNPYERGGGPALTDMAEIAVGLDGYLYATAPQTGLFRIDPETGDRELISELKGLSGLAIVPIPEPATLGMLVCLFGFALARRIGGPAGPSVGINIASL
ncbi:hypothetical protein MalM25_32080 [Planctomycetes bacterium MalM25]|nr:hypothetical protein MalM25_32080 [Planctomycetes bacterium MalM25]